MNPNDEVTLGLTILDNVLSLVSKLKGLAQMTDEQLVAHADSLDLQNKEDIKALLAQ